MCKRKEQARQPATIAPPPGGAPRTAPGTGRTVRPSLALPAHLLARLHHGAHHDSMNRSAQSTTMNTPLASKRHMTASEPRSFAALAKGCQSGAR